MVLDFLYKLYLLLLIAGIVLGSARLSKLLAPSQFILALLLVSCINELLVLAINEINKNKELFSLHNYINKSPFYFVDGIIEGILSTLFFLQVIKPPRYKIYAATLMVFWPLIAIINAVFFQSFYKLNTNFILLENFLIVAFALFVLYKILLSEHMIEIHTNLNFWLTCMLLLMSSGTLFFWMFIKIPSASKNQYINFAEIIQVTVNITVYTGIAVLFLLHPKMKEHELVQ